MRRSEPATGFVRRWPNIAEDALNASIGDFREVFKGIFWRGQEPVSMAGARAEQAQPLNAPRAMGV